MNPTNIEPITEADLARVAELDAQRKGGNAATCLLANYTLAEICPRLARELAAARAALAGLIEAIEVTLWTSDDGETKCKADADSLRLEYSQELGDAFEAALNTHTHE